MVESERTYDGSPERVLKALQRAAVGLGYQIQGLDTRGNTLFFKRGRRSKSGLAVARAPGTTALTLFGGGDDSTIHAHVAVEIRGLSSAVETEYRAEGAVAQSATG